MCTGLRGLLCHKKEPERRCFFLAIRNAFKKRSWYLPVAVRSIQFEAIHKLNLFISDSARKKHSNITTYFFHLEASCSQRCTHIPGKNLITHRRDDRLQKLRMDLYSHNIRDMAGDIIGHFFFQEKKIIIR